MRGMRSWIVAVRLGLGLGLGLANKKIGTTRFSSTSIESATATATEENNAKSIYLCFNERAVGSGYNGTYKNHVIRRIGLNTTSSSGNNPELLLVTDNKVSQNNISNPTRFTTFGSNIVFPLNERTYICWLDTSELKPKIRTSYPTNPNPKFRSFDQPKHGVHMGVVDGRLYSIGTDRMCKHFEVFNHHSLYWQPLPEPPFFLAQYSLENNYRMKDTYKFLPTYSSSFYEYDTRFLNESKKILGWVRGRPRVFCFDVTNPGNTWTQLDNPCLLNTIPFKRNHLFIHTHHPHIGDFYLIFTYKPQDEHRNLKFTYKPEDETLCVYPYFMSKTFDSFQPIDHPIHLPELCSRYIESGFEIDMMEMVYSFQFLELGDQKVGLVINTFGEGIGYVILVTFEYEIIVGVEKSKPNIKIQTRLLGTRRFVYHPMDLPPVNMPWEMPKEFDRADEARLDAAFFL